MDATSSYLLNLLETDIIHRYPLLIVIKLFEHSVSGGLRT